MKPSIDIRMQDFEPDFSAAAVLDKPEPTEPDNSPDEPTELDDDKKKDSETQRHLGPDDHTDKNGVRIL